MSTHTVCLTAILNIFLPLALGEAAGKCTWGQGIPYHHKGDDIPSSHRHRLKIWRMLEDLWMELLLCVLIMVQKPDCCMIWQIITIWTISVIENSTKESLTFLHDMSVLIRAVPPTHDFLMEKKQLGVYLMELPTSQLDLPWELASVIYDTFMVVLICQILFPPVYNASSLLGFPHHFLLSKEAFVHLISTSDNSSSTLKPPNFQINIFISVYSKYSSWIKIMTFLFW